MAATIIGAVFNWQDRIFEIDGGATASLSVVFQNLSIEGGDAREAATWVGLSRWVERS